MAQITFEDKETTRTFSVPAKNRMRAEDMNEIKTSVNELYDLYGDIELDFLSLLGGDITGDVTITAGDSSTEALKVIGGGYVAIWGENDNSVGLYGKGPVAGVYAEGDEAGAKLFGKTYGAQIVNDNPLNIGGAALYLSSGIQDVAIVVANGNYNYVGAGKQAFYASGNTSGQGFIFTKSLGSGGDPILDIAADGVVTCYGGLNLDTVGTGTAVTMLAIDASGNVVEGTSLIPATENLAATLAVGSTTSGNNITVSTGDRILINGSIAGGAQIANLRFDTSNWFNLGYSDGFGYMSWFTQGNGTSFVNTHPTVLAKVITPRSEGLDFKFGTATGTGTNTALSTRMTILNGGNVGLGTVSPSEKLEVVGNIKISGNMLKMVGITTTARNALTPVAGDIIYNTTDNKHQGYDGTTWNNLY